MTDRGSNVAEVAERLCVTRHSLYAWLRKSGKSGVVQRAELDHIANDRASSYYCSTILPLALPSSASGDIAVRQLKLQVLFLRLEQCGDRRTHQLYQIIELAVHS